QFFVRLAENMADHSIFDITARNADRVRRSVVCIRNQLPAPFLKARFAAAQTGTLFSATLAPWDFYANMLGLGVDTHWMDVAPPFQPHQLRVKIAGGVSTRYNDRAASVGAIVHLIAQQYRDQPGNYL